jgi:3-hydroxyacyl-[acyl-carrier-protein] dehydratase
VTLGTVMGGTATHRFAGDHPSAAGHFPGNPIIPGAALLDVALSAVAVPRGGGLAACAIRAAKFLHPVRPGETILIRWEALPDGEVRVECLLDGTEIRVMTGTIRLDGAAS